MGSHEQTGKNHPDKQGITQLKLSEPILALADPHPCECAYPKIGVIDRFVSAPTSVAAASSPSPSYSTMLLPPLSCHPSLHLSN